MANEDPRKSPGSVLVVDDDEDIRETMCLVLEGTGYPTLTAADGEEALHVLRTASPLPSVILLDLMMPGMDGWRFRAAQREDAALAHIPVVVHSGAGDLAKRTAELGASDVLEKPVALDVLIALVARYCGPPRAR